MTGAEFWTYVRKGPGCWEWQRSRDSHGYGRVRFRGSAAPRAHRVAWFLTFDEWPAVVRHRCDNPPCCNPDHLEAGTSADNSRDMVVRKRCINRRGEAASRSVLTEEMVREARRLRASGALFRELAVAFRLPVQTIYDAVRGRSWGWLDGVGPGHGRHGASVGPTKR